jgi:MarR family transcriptional regulator, lower aerobic nicotinate degradation pathway regulator
MEGVVNSAKQKQTRLSGLPDRDQSLGLLIRRAYQLNMTLFQKHSGDKQLTSVQLSVLYAIQEGQPCSLTDIGQRASIDPSTTRGVIDRLGKRGLIQERPDEQDKRRVLIELTPSGNELTAQMIEVVRAISEEMNAALNPGERVALVFLLNKMVSGIEGGGIS